MHRHHIYSCGILQWPQFAYNLSALPAMSEVKSCSFPHISVKQKVFASWWFLTQAGIYFSKPTRNRHAFHFTEWSFTSWQLMQPFWKFWRVSCIPQSSMDKFWNQFMMFLNTKSYFKYFCVILYKYLLWQAWNNVLCYIGRVSLSLRYSHVNNG